MKKFVFSILSVALLLSCNNSVVKNDDAVKDEEGIEADATAQQNNTIFIAGDYAMENLFGKVKKSVTHRYDCDESGKKVEEDNPFEIVKIFNSDGQLVSNVIFGDFDNPKITRDDKGRIVKIDAENDGAESHSVYTYEGEILVKDSEEWISEISGSHDVTFQYDEKHRLIKTVSIGVSDGIQFTHTSEYELLEFDDNGNWTKAVESYDSFEDDNGEKCSYKCKYILERKLEYFK